jgi:nitroimidazol reductase NimA-like FMN-containing flavoprotein (pyridoxamine 5'-phosphate oxidase superfamily)
MVVVVNPAPGDDRELSKLDREECVHLLRTMRVGRIAVAKRHESPLVVPVNYVMDGDVVVFRTDPGLKLDLLRRDPVSFQVDYIDLNAHTGWSVLVAGWAHEATEWEVGHLELEPWGPGEKPHWVRIEPDRITGRRLTRDFSAFVSARSYL